MAGSSVSRWAVDNQIETIGLDPTGKPVEGIKVLFHTDKVAAASVFIPRAGYNAEKVRAAIMEYLAHLDAVHNLSG